MGRARIAACHEAQFGQASDAFNHFAQDSNFNRGAYRALENNWAQAQAAGKNVRVWITPRYLGGSKRPYVIKVKWKIGGVIESQKFPNRKGGK